jgi:hypothetical protein
MASTSRPRPVGQRARPFGSPSLHAQESQAHLLAEGEKGQRDFGDSAAGPARRFGKLISRVTCAGGAVALLALALTSSSAHAHDPTFKFRAYGTAVVDGALAQGEWDAAAKWNFNANIPPSGTTPATLYLMNDGSTLYLALRVARPSLGSSSVAFDFDNDHDGVLFEDGDDALLLNPSIGFLDEFWTRQPPCPPNTVCGLYDAEGGGTNNGQGVATNNGSVSIYELSHPLDTTDDAHDFSLRLGKRVGFFMSLRFCAPNCVDTESPRFGDIVITSTSTVPPDTRITEGPAEGSLTADEPVTLVFTGSDDIIAPDDLTFECELDEGGFAPCTSPATHLLAEGRHSFAVRATDEVGNIDPTPDVRSWIIDTEAPSKPSVRGPRKLRQSRAVYRLSARDSIDTAVQLRYRCSVDRRSLKPCSRRLVVRLKRGRHVVRARAVDRTGHVSALTVVQVVRAKPPRRTRH